ncbi:MAG: tyrosine-type recombinase/integrase [Anaerolineae bacterium]|jgi:site-specific recombinase XerD
MPNDTTSGAGFQGEFREHLVAGGKSPHTIKAYTQDVRLFAEWFDRTNGRGLAPGRMTPIDVREYRSYLLAVKKQKPATVNRKLSSLSAFCEWAKEAGLITANPVDGISQVGEVRAAPKWLDKNEQYALLRAVQERGRKRDIALITLMLNTGLRVSEVSGLRVDDVTMSPRKGSVLVRGGKGEKFRTVPLNVDVRKALRAYLAERSGVEAGGYGNPPYVLGERPGVESGEELFVSQRGGSLQPAGRYYLVSRYAYDARLEDVTPHTLRHTFGKSLVDAGVPLDRVAQLLGHESVDTTRIYTTPRRSRLQREVEEIALA